MLEAGFTDLVVNLSQWKETEAKGNRAKAIYDKELSRLLKICNETLSSMVTDLMGNANALRRRGKGASCHLARPG